MRAISTYSESLVVGLGMRMVRGEGAGVRADVR